MLPGKALAHEYFIRNIIFTFDTIGAGWNKTETTVIVWMPENCHYFMTKTPCILEAPHEPTASPLLFSDKMVRWPSGQAPEHRS